MDQVQNPGSQDLKETPEDAALETEALQETKEAEVRARVAAEFGLDPTNPDHLPFLDRITSDRLESHKKLSTAIRQKKAWREKAQKPTPTPEEKPLEKITPPVVDISKEVDARLDARLDEEKLSEMDLSDEFKSELKAYAKAQGITARQALKSDYFTYLKDREQKAKREEEASAGSGHNPPARKTFDPDKPPAIDPNDPESIKRYDDWFDGVSRQG